MKNPTWKRDELILALDLFFKYPPQTVSQSHPEVVALSQFLGRTENLTYIAKCYKLGFMSTVVRISDELANDAKHRSKVEQRSMTAQLEYWAKIGKAAEDNPDLPFAFIKETLIARSEIESSQGEEYVFG